MTKCFREHNVWIEKRRDPGICIDLSIYLSMDLGLCTDLNICRHTQHTPTHTDTNTHTHTANTHTHPHPLIARSVCYLRPTCVSKINCFGGFCVTSTRLFFLFDPVVRNLDRVFFIVIGFLRNLLLGFARNWRISA